MSRGIKISRAPVPTCAMCGSLNAEYVISYWDRSRDQHVAKIGNRFVASSHDVSRACESHILEVTAKVLLSAGVIITGMVP